MSAKRTPPVEDDLVLRSGKPRGHGGNPLDLRQTLTALGATARENLAPALGRLTSTESDLARTLDLRGLPHHLHFELPSLVKN